MESIAHGAPVATTVLVSLKEALPAYLLHHTQVTIAYRFTTW